MDDGVGATVSCSVCLEAVVDGGCRSTAKLQCGHQFHLDCIGSAFNAKGAMQCPNCRKTEKGNWLFANGCFSLSELEADDWIPDEEIYDLSNPGRPYRIRWCPFRRYEHIPESFEDNELFPGVIFDDMLQNYAVFPENAASSSTSQPMFPFVAYAHHSLPFPLGSQAQTEITSDGPAFHDNPNSHAFSSVDPSYHGWDFYSSPPNHGRGADEPSISSVPTGMPRFGLDFHPRIGSLVRHPSASGHRSNSAADSPPIPLFHYVGRGRIHVQEFYSSSQHHSPHAMHGPDSSGVWGSGSIREFPPLGPAPHPPEHSAFYPFPHSAPLNWSPRDGDFISPFHERENGRFSSRAPLLDRNRPWSPSRPASGLIDSSSWNRVWPQNLQVPERLSSQSWSAHPS